MRVDRCVSSWFRIKNTHSLTPVPCPVSCERRIFECAACTLGTRLARTGKEEPSAAQKLEIFCTKRIAKSFPPASSDEFIFTTQETVTLDASDRFRLEDVCSTMTVGKLTEHVARRDPGALCPALSARRCALPPRLSKILQRWGRVCPRPSPAWDVRFIYLFSRQAFLLGLFRLSSPRAFLHVQDARFSMQPSPHA